MGTYFTDPIEGDSAVDQTPYCFVSNLNIEGFEIVSGSEDNSILNSDDENGFLKKDGLIGEA